MTDSRIRHKPRIKVKVSVPNRGNTGLGDFRFTFDAEELEKYVPLDTRWLEKCGAMLDDGRIPFTYYAVGPNEEAVANKRAKELSKTKSENQVRFFATVPGHSVQTKKMHDEVEIEATLLIFFDGPPIMEIIAPAAVLVPIKVPKKKKRDQQKGLIDKFKAKEKADG